MDDPVDDPEDDPVDEPEDDPVEEPEDEPVVAALIPDRLSIITEDRF